MWATCLQLLPRVIVHVRGGSEREGGTTGRRRRGRLDKGRVRPLHSQSAALQRQQPQAALATCCSHHHHHHPPVMDLMTQREGTQGVLDEFE